MKDIDGVLSDDEKAILEIDEWLNLRPMTTLQLYEEHKLREQCSCWESRLKLDLAKKQTKFLIEQCKP